MKTLIACIILSLAFSSCKKQDPEVNPPISNTPSLALKVLSPSTINQFDDLEFIIEFQDGDGDLGFEDADERSLIITDNRFPVEHSFHVPPQAPSSSNITIQGEFRVVLNAVILKEESNAFETANFGIKIRDRAGNWSPSITSPTVRINR